MRAADRPMLAETLKVRFAVSMGNSFPASAIDEWVASVDAHSGSHGAAELGYTLVDMLLQRQQPERAVVVAMSIGGDSWGLLRQVEAMCAIASHTGDASVLERVAKGLRDRPRSELIEYLDRMIEQARLGRHP